MGRIERVLDGSDLAEVFARYAAEDRDPAVYFFEEFLRAYDPQGVRERGVHYSPPAVVSYIVRGCESILRERFGCSLDDVVIFDPCCGVGTFLRYIARCTTYRPRMIGAELSPAACEIARRLLPGCDIRHADSLDEIDLVTDGAPLVILGNPPYSGHSSNAGKIADLMRDYREGLTERNPKWLQDDYVKFIRMAQARVEAAGRGVVAFITNHSYLSNPTFRAMRASLARTFQEISVLDLHGNAKRNDADGDENVFPIQMGVAVSFMVKSSDENGCRVRHAELRGSRNDKLSSLADMDYASTPWIDVTSAKPFHLFTPHDDRLREEYERFPSIFDLFDQCSVGFVTSRDAFAVAFDRDELLDRIAALRDERIPPDKIRARYPVGDLDIEGARRILREDAHWENRAVEALYRPFDRRWVYLSRAVMERPRLPFMESLLEGNMAIALGRAGMATGSDEWDVVFCTDCPTDLNLFRRGGAMLFPMYIRAGNEWVSNIAAPSPGGEEAVSQWLFYYVYAILHSSVYRRRYSDFLMIDFPRIPMPIDADVFDSLAALGKELMSVHLMRDTEAGDCGPRGAGSGSFATEATGHMMRIGGYDVPGKYISNRKHRPLTPGETNHVARIEAALGRSREITDRIDSVLRFDFLDSSAD